MHAKLRLGSLEQHQIRWQVEQVQRAPLCFLDQGPGRHDVSSLHRDQGAEDGRVRCVRALQAPTQHVFMRCAADGCSLRTLPATPALPLIATPRSSQDP